LLSGRDLRQLEPELAGGLPGALFVSGDNQVDNRALHRALLSAFDAAGGTVLVDEVRSVGFDHSVRTVRTTAGRTLFADWIVLAAGARSRSIDGIPESVRPPV